MGTNISTAADIRATMDALRCLIQELRVSARAVEQHHGISGAQLFVLQQLVAGEALSVGALAERTFTHQSSVSVVVSRLAKRGLVSRRNGADDARRTDVRLTARGRALLGRAPEVAQARLIAGLQRLRPSERCAVARGLAALVQQMGLRAGTSSLFFEDEDATTRRGRRGPRRRAL
jgi:MarR family transcriptional regulator, lower aerobic nicotinate degradation pathway regulator